MYKTRIKFRNVLVLLITMGLPGNAASGDELKWNLQPGDQFMATVTQESTTTTTVDKRTTKIESQTAITMEWTVQDSAESKNKSDTDANNDNNFLIQQKITAVEIAIGDPAVPSQAISINTSEPSVAASKTSKNMLKQIQPLVGLTFAVTMSPRGEIVSIAVPEPTKKTLAELPAGLQLNDLFSQPGLTTAWQQATLLLPNPSVQSGDEWETTANVNNAFGEFEQVRTMTWADTERLNQTERAVIELQSVLKPKSPDPTKASGNLISFRETGRLNFDISDGYFASSEITSETKSSVPYHETTIVTTIRDARRMNLIKQKK